MRGRGRPERNPAGVPWMHLAVWGSFVPFLPMIAVLQRQRGEGFVIDVVGIHRELSLTCARMIGMIGRHASFLQYLAWQKKRRD